MVAAAGAGGRQSCESCSRWARQNCLRQVGQRTPGCVGVLICVLHLSAAQADDAPPRVCEARVAVAGEVTAAGRNDDSHVPAFLQLWAVSVRWSRQKVLRRGCFD